MILGILLPYGRGKQIILGIIIDHGLGKDLVFTGISGSLMKPFIHKSGKLIHIQIHIRDIRKLYIFYTVKAFNYAVDQIICINCHGCPFIP
jgi:hypothetical protein